jgi:hypothetical protein
MKNLVQLKRLFIVFGFASSFLMLSCSKDGQPDLKKADVFVEEGIVNFKSKEVFDEYVKDFLTEKKQASLKELKANGFNSNLDYFKSITESEWDEMKKNGSILTKYQNVLMEVVRNEEKYVEKRIDDPFLGDISNKSNMFVIANDLYKVDYDSFYKLKNTKENRDNFILKNAQRIEIKSYDLTQNKKARTILDVGNQHSYTHNGQYMKATFDLTWTNVDGYYSNISGRTRHYGRFLGIWYQQSVAQIEVQVRRSSDNVLLTQSLQAYSSEALAGSSPFLLSLPYGGLKSAHYFTKMGGGDHYAYLTSN